MASFKVVTLGDSVAWGQGLRPEQKFDRLAGSKIAQAVGTGEPRLENRAHSGATILPSPQGPLDAGVANWQEVPNGSPTILDQADPPDGDASLVVLVGGMNDLNFRTILRPTETSEAELEDAIRASCYDAVKALLARARSAFPRAVLVVAGYYPMLSEQSDLDAIHVTATLLAFRFGIGLPFELLNVTLAKRATRRVRYFHRSQLHWLRRAVAEAQAEAGSRGPGVLFAHPALGPRNSVGAPEALLFGPHHPANPREALESALRDPLAAGLGIDPDDPMLAERRVACGVFRGGPDLVTCRVASIGHPNEDGAIRYADTIRDVYLANRRWSLRPVLAKLSGGRPGGLGLRAAFGRYGLAAGRASARDHLQHVTVDSVAVTIRTRDEPGAGTDHPVYLRLGTGREWRLNEDVLEGDLFDDFERGREGTYFIDPAEGDPGARLRLAEIEEVTLVMRYDVASTLGGDWKPESLRLALNGREVVSAPVDKELHVDPFNRVDRWSAPGYPA